MIRRNVRLVPLTLLLVILLVATACSSDSADTTVTTAATTTTTSGGDATTTTAATEPAPVEKTLTMALSGVPNSIDPAVLEGRPSLVTTQGVVSTLVRYTLEPSPGLTLHSPQDLQPELAESFESNADGSVTFTLREAASPYGNTVTSADVKWSFDRMIALDGVARFLMSVSSIDQENAIEVIDDRTFTLNVTQPNTLTLPVLTYYALGILDSVEAQAHATADDEWAAGWLGENSATFGPYQIEEIVPAEEIRLLKNPNYWNAAAVDLDRIVMRSVPDSGNRMLLIAAGEVDFIADLTFDLFASVVNSGALDLAFQDARDTNLDELSLNNRFPPFDDVGVREAVSLAIDRDALLVGAYGGFGTVAGYPLSTAIPQPSPPADVAASYDPERARTLLADAGYPSGFNFTLTINPTRPGPHAEGAAVIIASQLRDVGINATIDVIASAADFNAAVGGGELEGWLYSVRPVIGDPAYTIPLLFASTGLGYEGYANARVDELTALILAEPEGPVRDEFVAEAARILAQEFPFVPLVETIIPWVFVGGLEGAVPNPTGFLYPQDLALP